MSKRQAGDDKHTTGGVGARLASINNTIVAAPVDNIANLPYDRGTRMRLLDHTNLIPDLVSIIQDYTAFSGAERLTLSGHEKFVTCVAVFANGNICSSSGDGTIKIWNRVNGQCIQTLTGRIYNTKNK